jgi:hypothetical protein
VFHIHLIDVAKRSFYTIFKCAFVLTVTVPLTCNVWDFPLVTYIGARKVSGFGAFQTLDIGVWVAQPAVYRLLSLAAFT